MREVEVQSFDNGKKLQSLFAVFAIALAIRLIFVFAAPWVGGDGWKYLLVAENIFRNFCVAVSDPATGACMPHWGGNQMPGYPFFIAANWTLFGQTTAPILVSQAVLAAAAIAWLARSLWFYTGSALLSVFVGLLLAVSPLQIAWPRQAMTETLAIALTTFLLAELVRSLDQGKLRIWSIAPVLIATFYCRYDSILLCVPVAVVAFIIHRPLVAIRQGIILSIIVSIPVGGWLIRNVASGLTALPVPYQTADGSEGPTGYIAWIKTWNTSLYDSMGSTFPIATQSYSQIVIPDKAYREEVERAQITALLAELGRHDGGPFPVKIDRAFRKIATARRDEEPIRYWLLNPAKRVLHQWLTPFSGFGWPTATDNTSELRRIRALVRQGPSGVIEAIWSYPAIALTKGLVAGYRYALLVLAGFIGYAYFKWGSREIRLVVLLGLSYAVIRTLALSFFNESRYLIGAIPGLEMAVGAGLVFLWQQRSVSGIFHAMCNRQRRG